MRLMGLAVLLFAVPAVGQDVTFGTSFDRPQTRLRAIKTHTRWDWTQAATHHDAVVRISTPGGEGTGVMIASDCPGALVLTGTHVLIPHKRAVMTSTRTGEQFQCEVLYGERNSDAAILYAPNARPAVTLPIGGFIPQRGEKLEIIGLGGTERLTRRHFAGAFLGRRQYDGGLDIDCDCISGDSGSPIVYQGKSVIGLVRGGADLFCRNCNQQIHGNGCPRCGESPFPYNRPTQSDVTGPHLAKIVTQICQPRGWTPGIVNQRCEPLYPTQPVKPVRPINPTPGPAGPAGPQGPPGPAGLTVEEITTIIRQIIDEDPERFRGRDGAPGRAGIDGKDGRNGADGIAGPTTGKVDVVLLRNNETLDSQTVDVDGRIGVDIYNLEKR